MLREFLSHSQVRSSGSLSRSRVSTLVMRFPACRVCKSSSGG